LGWTPPFVIIKEADMHNYKVCVIGGWCGNRMIIVAEHLEELFDRAGFPCRVTTHSVWENYNQPPKANLILQLLPAFTESETNCPVITIKPLLIDLDHYATIEKILKQVQADYIM
jgi:hypothetical protein